MREVYIERHLEKEVKKASRFYPVVLVCGQRQVGKSTMLYKIKEKSRNYVTFDDNAIRRLAKKDPDLFFETYKPPLIIDEFQRVPSILITLKKIIDNKKLKGKKTNGLYWLTGSQKFKMMKNVSESLAGRIAILEMSSLSSREISKKSSLVFDGDIKKLKINYNPNKDYVDISKLYKKIFTGGLPKIVSTKINRNNYYMDYINTYLERDIKELSQVGHLDTFYDFLVYMAARTSNELKYDEISKNLGISAPTAKQWVSILERTGAIFILKPYSNNITKRLVKTPKIYFMDTGLVAYLCGWDSPKTLQNGAMSGEIFETYVISEIVKGYLNNRAKMDLYYYRDIDKKEIDLLIVKNGSITPIEIKKNKNPDDATKNFDVLNKFKMNVKKGSIICMSEEFIPYDRKADLCPVSSIL